MTTRELLKAVRDGHWLNLGNCDLIFSTTDGQYLKVAREGEWKPEHLTRKGAEALINQSKSA